MKSIKACIVYISEGRNEVVLNGFKELLQKQKGIALLNTTVDRPYNRTGYTLAAYEANKLVGAATALAKDALSRLNLSDHDASHPRLGVVDHISCHNLDRDASLEEPAAIARQIGGRLGSEPHEIPVLLYGSASSSQAQLADLRRALGYFVGSTQASWSGARPREASEGIKSDFGPQKASATSGVAMVGATPWITNYNILLDTKDLGKARNLARQISQRGGGLKNVQAMALRHKEGTEIACNLLGGDESLLIAANLHMEELCGPLGFRILHSYRIGQSPEEYSKLAAEMLR